MSELILFKNMSSPGFTPEISSYLKSGGYKSLEKALKEMTPDQIIETVKKSGLRGRGGAGFPTGTKWGFIPKDPSLTKYLCVNADEGEPGTFKDRQLMEKDPHQLLEGIAIASYAIGAHTAYIYVRGELDYSMKVLEKAIEEAKVKGYLGSNICKSGFDLEVYVHPGAGAYICGEETALIESLEGKRGKPRFKPPFPANYGLYGKPTVVNNVETLSNIPQIVKNGGEWFAGIGVGKSTGTRLFSLSGHVKKPGNYEVVLGETFRHLIYDLGGGILNDKKLKAIVPGGASATYFTEEHLDVMLDFEAVAAAGSMLGSGAVTVIDEETCMVWTTLNFMHFFAHESCGKCTPCREGAPWLYKIVHRIEHGEGKMEDLDLLTQLCGNIAGKTVCAFGEAEVAPILGGLKYFRHEFEHHIREKNCPVKHSPRLETIGIP